MDTDLYKKLEAVIRHLKDKEDIEGLLLLQAVVTSLKLLNRSLLEDIEKMSDVARKLST